MEDSKKHLDSKNFLWCLLAAVGSCILNFLYGFFVFIDASKAPTGGAYYVLPYFFLAFFWIYIVLFRLNKIVRDTAFYALLVPWCFFAIILIPQLKDEPESVILFIISFLGLILMKLTGDFIVKSINKRKEDAS